MALKEDLHDTQLDELMHEIIELKKEIHTLRNELGLIKKSTPNEEEIEIIEADPSLTFFVTEEEIEIMDEDDEDDEIYEVEGESLTIRIEGEEE